ncbi:MAG: hypothetical protein QM722_15030 [Piscinibacter sp.]
MFADVINSIKATLYDRTSSPLFGAFALSWAGWNFRLLLVFFSEGNYAEKLIYVTGILYRDELAYFLSFLLYPLATAVIVIYAYPIPARKVYEYTARQQKKLRELRQAIEGDELISVEEARNLRQSHIELQLQFDAQFKRMKEERDALQLALTGANQEKTNLNVHLTNLDKVTKERDTLVKEVERLRAVRQALDDQTMLTRGSQAMAAQRAAYLADSKGPTAQEMEYTLWQLVFNPANLKESGSKHIHLLGDGKIGEGRSSNEHRWRITDGGQLEFVQADGAVHSRFNFVPDGPRWSAAHDSDVRMKSTGQFMVPVRLSDIPPG